MISEQIEKALNDQINAEFYSAYLYLSMNSYFLSINLNGSASWMRSQALEELTHADKFYRYVSERGGRVLLGPVEGPQSSWASPLNAFEDAYRHEQKVTARINDLMDLAIREKDHATVSMLQWFVDEQVEEESSISGIVGQLRLVGDNTGALVMLDRELGMRVFVSPVQTPE